MVIEIFKSIKIININKKLAKKGREKNMRIIARLDIKNSNLIKSINLEG